MKKVLVVCANPGDDILGCGGTLALHSQRGDDIRVAILGDGWTSRVKTVEKGMEVLDLDALELQGREALSKIGVDQVEFFRFPDNRFDNIAMLDLIKSIEKVKDRYPFNLLWGKAFELLNCDVLRIVGCNLSQNDWGLISLLFNTQLERGGIYEIELIRSHEGGEEIRKKFGFLKNVRILGELDDCQDLVDSPPKNTFESWLRRKLEFYKSKGVSFDKMVYINKIMGED